MDQIRQIGHPLEGGQQEVDEKQKAPGTRIKPQTLLNETSSGRGGGVFEGLRTSDRISLALGPKEDHLLREV